MPEVADPFSTQQGRSGWLPFALLSLMLFAMFFAAGAPSPLFRIFQQSWGFSSGMLAFAFAVYALALLAVLLVAGALSDYVGRRPVVVAALLLEALSMVLFYRASGLSALIAARVVQGVATGLASGALTAAVLEAAKPGAKALGALVSSVAPLAGLAGGVVAAGAAIKWSGQPAHLLFGGLAILFFVGGLLTGLVPETARTRAGVMRSLIPNVSVPGAARRDYWHGLPVLMAVWSMGGLYLSLMPSLLHDVLRVHDGVLGGLAIAVLPAAGAIAPVLMRRVTLRKSVRIGLFSIAGGMGLVLMAVYLRNTPLFMAGTCVAGIGFGSAFSAHVQMLAPQVPAHARAQLFAAIFVASYLAFSVPTMVAGVLATSLGLLPTVMTYMTGLITVALVGVGMQLKACRHTPSQAASK